MARHILIVDDDPTVRDVLQEIVTTYGYEAHGAPTAKDAVSILAKARIDLIFLDISMPEITGDQMLDFIRKKGFHTPVVVVSAHVDDAVRDRLKAAGVDGILGKPFEVSDVIDEMEKGLSKRKG